ASPRFECAKLKRRPSQVRIGLARGNSTRHQTVAKRRGYLFRRPGRGCHVARLLDEPTASLDPDTTKAIEDVIRSVTARGIKVVKSTAGRKARSSSRREGSSMDAVTAIRDQDGNDATERDAGWTSFRHRCIPNTPRKRRDDRVDGFLQA